MSQELLHQQKLPPILAYTLLFLIFISTFRIFATLPLESLHQSLSSFAIILLSVYYVFSLLLTVRDKKITRLDVLMWVFILVNFFAAYQGHAIFKQPYYYGIMAQRSVLLSLSGILLISLLRKGWITIQQVERSFVIISLSLLIIFYFFFLFVNPVKFTDMEFVAYSPIRGYRYRFQFALVIMLLFYSLFKVSHEKKNGYIAIVLLIIFYLVYFLQSRTTLVVLAFTLLIYFFRNFTLREKIRNTIIYGSVIIVAGALLFSLGYTSLYDKYHVLYSNVYNIFFGETSDEASSAVRFMEFNIALDYIEKNPILGNGFISNQWNGGWRDILGYFYPVDIGLLGNIFVFGLLGTCLIYLPYYFSLSMSRQVHSNHVFFKTIEYMLLFFFLSMFFSAVNIRDSSSIMFLVCLLYYFRYDYFGSGDLLPSSETVIA
ncbi:MAG TPA: O-antigen ligase family protein [Bacteroidia bacterium]|nr:O-antigen ligase family protein [Bacteroidia bacterium]HNP98922.1 O-antigen ligase family protein [Bacteroidia bacterium]